MDYSELQFNGNQISILIIGSWMDRARAARTFPSNATRFPVADQEEEPGRNRVASLLQFRPYSSKKAATPPPFFYSKKEYILTLSPPSYFEHVWIHQKKRKSRFEGLGEWEKATECEWGFSS